MSTETPVATHLPNIVHLLLRSNFSIQLLLENQFKILIHRE